MIGCWPRSFSSDGGVGGEPVLVFFCGREAELVEEHLAQLRRGVDVELVAGVGPDLARAARSHSAVSRSFSARSSVDVDADADVLHAGQHPHERHLDVVVQRAQPCASSAASSGGDEPVDGQRHGAPCRRSSVGAPSPPKSSWPSGAGVGVGQLGARRSGTSSSSSR